MPKYYVDSIWPRKRVNLVAGASGAGKTRWMIPQLFALLEGKSILGHRADTLKKIAYVACDRTSEDAKDTMSDMGFDPTRLFIYSFMDNEVEWHLNKVIDILPPSTDLVYIEAIGALVPHGKINDYHEVLRFGRQLNRAMRIAGCEITGSTHVPKLKQDENFKHTRENIFGAASWAGFAGTIVVIEETSTGQRAIHVLTRDGKAEKFIFEFTETGHLTESSQAIGSMLMDRWLKGIAPGTDLLTSFLVESGERYKLSRATVNRWITACCDEGRLTSVERGLYRKRSEQ